MNRKINAIALLLLGVVLTPEVTFSQLNSLRPRIGLYGQGSSDMSSASFTQLPGVPSCCPEYSSTSGIGVMAGLSYVSPFTNTWALDVRLGFASYGADFLTTETKKINLTKGSEVLTEATINHELNTSFMRLGIEPLLTYYVANDFNLKGGLSVGFVASNSFSQREVLVTPGNATFDNQRRERNVFTDKEIPDVTTLLIGITVGAGYDLAMNSDKSLTLTPEVLFTFNPQAVVEGISWNINHLRAGLALHYTPPASDSLSDEELLALARTIPAPERGTSGIPFIATLTAQGLTSDGRTQPLSSVRVEEYVSTRLRPLLPYVFFNEGSSDMRNVYREVSPENTDSFKEENFYNLDAMITYQHLLNIVGHRMAEDNASTITLTGCTDPSEGTDNSLAKRRSEEVKKYLTKTWGISGDRIIVEARGLPESPSNQNEVDGRAENRRVEITSSNPAILAPITTVDTMKVFEPAGVRFLTGTDPKSPVKSWALLVSKSDTLVKSFNGGDPVPGNVDWRMDEQARDIKNGSDIKAMLVLRDSTGLVIPSESTPVPINYVSLSSKQNAGTNKTIDRYSMILFGFDKADITPANQAIVSTVKSRIQPNSTVKVIGYTDRSGAEDYNQRLSDQRAKVIARALGVPEINATGLGERLPLYDNSTPEGRFYSRTVEVLVETPQR